MHIDDLRKILKEHQDQLSQILDDCEDGSAELALLATKMRPLLEDFSNTEAQLFEEKKSKDASLNTDTSTRK